MTTEISYDRPIEVAEGIFWVGYRDENTNFTCNPYLIIEDDKAVLIDSGSRSDFSAVMMKILQTGVDPAQIIGLVYQHYDPDLCGSMPNFIDICEHPDLRIISEKRNNIFISYYIHRDRYNLLKSVDSLGNRFFLNQRPLKFINTPYSHSPGSFVTFDEKTGTLFSSDLFGSFATLKDLFLNLKNDCLHCEDLDHCPNNEPYCPVKSILSFHRDIMPCNKALRYAIRQIKHLDISCIAPQHGSILQNATDIAFIINQLEMLNKVGIDGYDA